MTPASRSTRTGCEALVDDPLAFVGDADRQIDRVTRRIAAVVDRHPVAAAYDPEPLL